MAALTMKELLEAGVHFGHQPSGGTRCRSTLLVAHGLYLSTFRRPSEVSARLQLVRDRPRRAHHALQRHQSMRGDCVRERALLDYYVNSAGLGGTLRLHDHPEVVAPLKSEG